jgi:hypothetical protein
MKLAAIEAMWETHDAPAPFTAIGFPDQEARETHYAVEIPWVHGPDRHPVADARKSPASTIWWRIRGQDRERASSPMTR